MKTDKKKDALTDVVDISTAPQSGNSDTKVGEGQVVASSGEVITLGYGLDEELDKAAKIIVKDLKNRKKI